MRLRTLLVMLVLFTSAASAAAQVQRNAPASLDELAAAEQRRRILEHRRRLMPGPISDAEFESWKTLLELDEYQEPILEAVATEYRQRVRNLEKEHLRDISILWPAAFEYNSRIREVRPVHTPKLLELYDEHLRLLRKLLNADRFAFNRMRTQLQPDQAIALRRRQIERLHSMIDVPVGLREGRTDMTMLIESFLTPDEFSRVRGALERHLADFADELSERIADKRRNVDLARARYLIEVGPRWEFIEHAETRMRVAEALHAFDDQERDLWLWILESNWEALKRIAVRLEEKRADELRDLYLRSVWPELYDEQDEVLSFADRMGEWLPDPAEDEVVRTHFIDARDRLVDNLRRLIERAVERRFADGRRLDPLTLTISEAAETLHHFDAAERLAAEIDWLTFRNELRERLQDFTASLLTLYRIHRPDDLDEINRLRESLEHREEADRFRITGLQGRLEEVLQQRDRDETAENDSD